MSQEKLVRPFGTWEPAITPSEVYSDYIILGDPHVVGRKVYWAEMRPADEARIVVVELNEDGSRRDITPPDVSVRTRVHEYGGRAFVVTDKHVVFSNFADQRLYLRELLPDLPEAVALTPEVNTDSSLGKYGALVVSPGGDALVFICEKEYEDKENMNCIAALDLRNEDVCEPTILVSGNDFYGDPCFSPDGKKIAWITWNHPNMPWNSSELFIADIEGLTIQDGTIQKVAGGDGISVGYPDFDSKGRLYWIMDVVGCEEDDPKNWWNIYQFDGKNVSAVTDKLAEFANPMWVVGRKAYAMLADIGQIAVKFSSDGSDHFALLNPDSRELKEIVIDYSNIYGIAATQSKEIILRVGSSDRPTSMLRLNASTSESEVVATMFTLELPAEEISKPTLIRYSTEDKEHAYGQLYLPRNSKFEAPSGSKPPLIVNVHGGPTAKASTNISLATQFWTSLGYAILDVDHRGSVSYGRRFRDKLQGQWGEIDATDVRDAVNYLRAEGVVSDKIAISGGSAGGFSVQRALTQFPDLFKVGASYFGIGNLLTLAKHTHKFESRYLEGLLGGPLETHEHVYKDRSPINHMDRLKAPMILLQGADDKVVVPEVSLEIVRILKERGIMHEYVEYEGEAHGFRRKENNIDALTRESEFYRKVLFS